MMEYARLDELMKNKNKSKANLSDRKDYYDEMARLFAEEGYSDKADFYFRNGFSYERAKPIFDFLKTSSEPYEVYKRMVFGKRFDDDPQVSFRLMLHLLALILNEMPSEKRIIVNIIAKLPSLSLSKNHEPRKDTNRDVERFFLQSLSGNVPLPTEKELGIGRKEFAEFRSMIQKSMDKSQISTKIISFLKAWFEVPEVDEAQNLSLKDFSPPPVLSTPPTVIENKPTAQESNISLISWENALAALSAHIKALESQLREKNRHENKLQAQEERIRELVRYLDEKEQEKSVLRKRILSLEAEITVIDNGKNELLDNISELREECGKRDERIESLEKTLSLKDEEIEKRKNIEKMIERDNQKSFNDFIARVSTGLIPDYRDFEDALSLDMSIDLGENMRLQLQSVFKILKKNGFFAERG